jgi:hypothetical protein
MSDGGNMKTAATSRDRITAADRNKVGQTLTDSNVESILNRRLMCERLPSLFPCLGCYKYNI